MVIVRDDLIGSPQKVCPTMLDYKIMADADSMYNTPPCWSMYVCGLVFKKLLAEGGLPAVQERNEAKARRPALPCPLRPHSCNVMPPLLVPSLLSPASSCQIACGAHSSCMMPAHWRGRQEQRPPCSDSFAEMARWCFTV